MTGKIVKGIAGFYYIHVDGMGIYECKAKGIFRNKKIKPLVGDNVDIEILDEDNKLGNINDILPRTNELIRPAVANVDQVLIVFAAAEPTPNFNLLDRFLLMMNKQQVNTTLCFNKTDIVCDKEVSYIEDIYDSCGYDIIFTSTYENKGIEAIRTYLEGKTTVFAGPSGVGKSSMLNTICNEKKMETGVISDKIKRGKHTTRHSELIYISENTYIMDTPGFSTLYINEFDKEELKDYFIEFTKYEDKCKFRGCSHINEPNCAVKEALARGDISELRYNNYVDMYEELKNQRRW